MSQLLREESVNGTRYNQNCEAARSEQVTVHQTPDYSMPGRSQMEEKDWHPLAASGKVRQGIGQVVYEFSQPPMGAEW